ncbi:ribonuclease domain-containing protein [Erwinia sp.]|uniref:ribonuclease domain-containing protein n=1 Tax=Erwinia citreus TaxID=558 RepID=UPI003C780C75
MNKKLIIAAILAIVATAAGLRHPSKAPAQQQQASQTASQTDSSSDISTLTEQQRVADYLHQHQRLPGYYLTKGEARKQGWEPSKGNLCKTLPGRAIGGDRFSNREKVLPEKQGRRWFEADVNYDCGRRGSDRMLYSSDGLIYVTKDHYRHVDQVY